MKLWAMCTCLIAASSFAHAENWKVVGFLEPIQTRVYVDVDSVVDREKFHTANMKTEDSPAINWYKALCNDPNSDAALQFPGDYSISIQKPMVWEKGGTTFSMSVETLRGIFNTACKKPWEVWK